MSLILDVISIEKAPAIFLSVLPIVLVVVVLVVVGMILDKRKK